MEMTDEEVVKRFAAIVRVGSVRFKKTKTPARAKQPWKDMWSWMCWGNDCKEVATMFFPYLGTRRRTAASNIMALQIKSKPRKKR